MGRMEDNSFHVVAKSCFYTQRNIYTEHTAQYGRLQEEVKDNKGKFLNRKQGNVEAPTSFMRGSNSLLLNWETFGVSHKFMGGGRLQDVRLYYVN